MELGNEEQPLIGIKNRWECGDELPEWVGNPEHRLLLTSELLERKLKMKDTVEIAKL